MKTVVLNKIYNFEVQTVFSLGTNLILKSSTQFPYLKFNFRYETCVHYLRHKMALNIKIFNYKVLDLPKY